jgi:hypothetical protein
LTVPQDATEFPASPVSSTENFTERNGVTGKFGAHGLAQEFPFVEDAHLGHVPWVNPQGDRFPNIGGQRHREIAEVLKMNSVGANEPCF